MPSPTPDPLADYRLLRSRTDAHSSSLADLHCRHLACKPGCHDCCTDLTVWPVEYHAILAEMRSAGLTHLPLIASASCPFLTTDGLCSIYRFRPLICRTHGLPVAFLHSDGDDTPDSQPQMTVSFCPKNFIDADEETLSSFGPHNTLDLETLNADLSDLNDAFVESHPTPLPRRIPLRQLATDLSPR